MGEPTSSSPSSGTAATRAASSSSAPGRTLALLALLLAALALTLSFYLLRRDGEQQRRIAQERADALARDQRDADVERRLGDLEHQWAQAQSEAEAGTGLTGDTELRQRREQLALLDIERLVEQTQLQLRLGANPSMAIDVLAVADARLGRLASPKALRVQTALRHDLARLKAAADVDRGALAARLDPLLTAVDGWRVSADSTHSGLRPSGPATTPSAPATQAADSFGARVRAWIESEFGDLLRIREVNTPDALLLNPVQQQLLRERFRLGVLDLRQAILARDERIVRSESAALEDLMAHYFDPGQPAVAIAASQLRSITVAATSGPSPSLDETLGALRAVRGAPERAGNG